MLESNSVPQVIVLLATYNGANYCESQIVSILWQRGVNCSIIVRDDGSSDKTGRIISRLAHEFPGRITLIDNKGISKGSAAGNFFVMLDEADLTDADFVAFADQDDVWTPDKLIRGIVAMRQIGADGYSSDLIAYNEIDNAAWLLRKSGNDASLDYLFQGGSAGCTYIITPKLTRMVQSILAAAPEFCPDPSHDWIIYAIARSHGLTWFRDPGAEIIYRQHRNNQYGSRIGWVNLRAKAEMVRSAWLRNHVLWLENVVQGTKDEQKVFAAVRGRKARDKAWLIKEAKAFRRDPADVARLRMAIIAGLI